MTTSSDLIEIQSEILSEHSYENVCYCIITDFRSYRLLKCVYCAEVPGSDSVTRVVQLEIVFSILISFFFLDFRFFRPFICSPFYFMAFFLVKFKLCTHNYQATRGHVLITYEYTQCAFYFVNVNLFLIYF